MSGLAWKDVRKEFVFDGALLDVFIFDTGLADWQRVLDALRTEDFYLAYSLDSKPAELPADVRRAFEDCATFSTMLSVRFRGLLSNAFFHSPGEIVFDIDPREITGQAQLDALVCFMRRLADAVGKDAVLTPEGWRQAVILRVRPGEPPAYHPPRR